MVYYQFRVILTNGSVTTFDLPMVDAESAEFLKDALTDNVLGVEDVTYYRVRA